MCLDNQPDPAAKTDCPWQMVHVVGAGRGVIRGEVPSNATGYIAPRRCCALYVAPSLLPRIAGNPFCLPV